MNVVIGKYVPMKSFIHDMDPRLKLLINIAYIVLFFVISHFITLMALFFILIIAFLIATHRPMNLIKMMKMPIIIGVFILIINGFVIGNKIIDDSVDSAAYLSPDVRDFLRSSYWKSGAFNISYIAILKAFLTSFRIYSMILVTTIVTFTTKPILLTKAIEDLLFPFKLIRIPVHIFAMIISIALRFVPTLLLEANRIMKAQASRGVDFKNGKGKEKIKSMVTLTIPLFVIAFQRAEDLGNAMEVRGFDPYEKRTRYRSLRFKWFDYLIAFSLLMIIIAVSLFEANVGNLLATLPEWYQYTFIKL